MSCQRPITIHRIIRFVLKANGQFFPVLLHHSFSPFTNIRIEGAQSVFFLRMVIQVEIILLILLFKGFYFLYFFLRMVIQVEIILLFLRCLFPLFFKYCFVTILFFIL